MVQLPGFETVSGFVISASRSFPRMCPGFHLEAGISGTRPWTATCHSYRSRELGNEAERAGAEFSDLLADRVKDRVVWEHPPDGPMSIAHRPCLQSLALGLIGFIQVACSEQGASLLNTSLPARLPGPCGDGVVNLGESCDGGAVARSCGDSAFRRGRLAAFRTVLAST